MDTIVIYTQHRTHKHAAAGVISSRLRVASTLQCGLFAASRHAAGCLLHAFTAASLTCVFCVTGSAVTEPPCTVTVCGTATGVMVMQLPSVKYSRTRWSAPSGRSTSL